MVAVKTLPDQFIAKGISAWIPGQCGACKKWPAHGLCEACYALFKKQVPRCATCAIELPSEQLLLCGHCLKQPFAFDTSLTAVAYVSPWKEMVQAFKFSKAIENSILMAQLMHLVVELHTPLEGRPDVLLPIPTTGVRAKERGYNQSWELTKRLAYLTKVVATPSILQYHPEKNLKHIHQVHLKRRERLQALKGAFVISEAHQSDLTGKHVVLIDDVMTTGATLHHAALELKKCGVEKVSVWVFARTPEERS